MTRRPRLILLLLVGLVVWGPTATAWAHLERGPMARHAAPHGEEAERPESAPPRGPASPVSGAMHAVAERQAPPRASNPLDGPRHPTPPAAALLAGALVFLVAIARRRQGLALALAAMLALLAGEGVLHAALHVGHVSHGDGLAIGAAASAPTILDAGADKPSARPLPATGAAPQLEPRVAVANTRLPDRGRAPPPTPA